MKWSHSKATQKKNVNSESVSLTLRVSSMTDTFLVTCLFTPSVVWLYTYSFYHTILLPLAFLNTWKISVNCFSPTKMYGVFSHDVTAAMLVSQNKEMAAMLVSQTKPKGIELYFYANTFFCFSKPIWPVVT